jgi:acyl-CoA synthetase (NDP forming)
LRDPTGLAGDVSIVSPSGAFCVSLLTDTRRFGFSHVVSRGNEAVLAAADYLEYLADDPHKKIIGVFIETVRQPERFAAALERAERAGKPVLALKVGCASCTRHAVTTHTGGEAGNPGEISELLRAHRAIEVTDLLELTEVLAAQDWKPPAGRRIGVITSSGGQAELILDLAATADLQVPPLAPASRAGGPMVQGQQGQRSCDDGANRVPGVRRPRFGRRFFQRPGTDASSFSFSTQMTDPHM